MSLSEFKPPRRRPSQRSHLERLAGDYGRAHGIAHERARRWLSVQVSFAGKDWQTLQIEVARPEATEPELVPVAIGIADFKLDGPERVVCLALRYQVAQKLHAVTEQPDGRTNHRFWDLIDLQLQRWLARALCDGGRRARRRPAA